MRSCSRADYLAIGPIYGTSTKETGTRHVVSTSLAMRPRSGKPVVAIGGITLDRVSELMDAGVDAVAVITDLLEHGDPEARARQYVHALS